MALDKRIQVGLESEGMDNQYGEYVEGTITWHDLWAEVRDGGADIQTAGGVNILRVLGGKVFRVRWREDIVTTPPTRVFVRDEYNQLYNVGEIIDLEERRRFVDLRGERAS